jgi:hypothetical protein
VAIHRWDLSVVIFSIFFFFLPPIGQILACVTAPGVMESLDAWSHMDPCVVHILSVTNHFIGAQKEHLADNYKQEHDSTPYRPPEGPLKGFMAS